MKLKMLFSCCALLLALPFVVSCGDDKNEDSFAFTGDFVVQYDCLKGSSEAEMNVSICTNDEANGVETLPVVQYQEGEVPKIEIQKGIYGEAPKKAFFWTFYITAPSVQAWADRTDTLKVSYDKRCQMKSITYNGVNLENAYSDNGSGIYVEKTEDSEGFAYKVIHVTK